MREFGYIALFAIAALSFAATMVIIPVILRLFGLVPRKPGTVKNSTFECGMDTIGKTLVRFNFRYYFFALLFVVIDILAIFLYPWAVGLRQIGVFGLTAILVFIFLILVGYLYAWKKKVLEWK
jgi:NADH-quinone oxidoreductase subunit A